MITVVIPSYNPKDYIIDCLDSLENQVLDFKDFEVIVILNGDVEKYYDMLIGKLNDYSMNITIKTTNVIGVSNARNIGIDSANGEYICFIDDDDVVSPYFLSGLLKLADHNTIVVSNILTFSESITNLSKKFHAIYAIERAKDSKRCSSLIYNRSIISFPVAKLVHKDIIRDRRFDLKINNSEDTVFFTLISDRIKKIIVTDDNNCVYYIRLRHGDSLSSNKYSLKYITRNLFYVIIAYMKILIHINKYNFIFVLSRILAGFKTCCILLKNSNINIFKKLSIYRHDTHSY